MASIANPINTQRLSGLFLRNLVCVAVFLAFHHAVFAQAELMPYGNLNGIRIKGQLMEFKTSLVVAGKDWSRVQYTAKEKQHPKFKREGDVQTINTSIDSVFFTETVEDKGSHRLKLKVACVAHANTALEGVYLAVDLPAGLYANSVVDVKGAGKQTLKPEGDGKIFFNQNTRAIKFTADAHTFEIKTDTLIRIFCRSVADDAGDQVRIYLPILTGSMKNGTSYTREFEISAQGPVNETPAVMQLDATHKGRLFAGFGGNFRLQNPKADPEVIDYCLDNMRVAWGRVEMPWRFWQPEMDTNPITAADQGQLNAHVRASMEMAQRLYKMNIPLVVTAWAPPGWAVVGPLHQAPVNGIWGNPLNYDHIEQSYKSIADYLIYLRDHYGVEVKCFSFNESDLGINIRQTAEEHDRLIKGLGAYFASRGLTTKLLLGDNSDATTYKFIYAAMNDPEAKPYIGAISFHSWRGWDTPILKQWYQAAQQLDLPLIVGEGSIDAAAWAYPAYFEEESYALEEINLYMRLLGICQPLSILQWQLTADYSPLIGGGIFGTGGPLQPTQRFWNLKQLAATPKDVYHFPVTVSNTEISCAAFGDALGRSFTFHIVNNGPARQITLKGLPEGLQKLKVIITDKERSMKELSTITVKNHQAMFKLQKRCYTTLQSGM